MSNELFDEEEKVEVDQEFELGQKRDSKPQVSAKPEAKLQSKKKGNPITTKDKIFFGGVAVIGLGLIFLVLMPSGNSVGQTANNGQIAAADQRGRSNTTDGQQMMENDYQTQISEILIKQKKQQDKDRADYQQGMQILSQQLKVANERVNKLGEQLNELRMNGATTHTATDSANNARSFHAEKALRGYSINDISQELAWIKYKDQLYAVKQGTQIGNVIVTRIDVSNRIVYTNEGVIH